MTVSRSDVLVFFGATGDLAYKKIFPALHAMVRRNHLDVPVVGVARSKWTLDQFKARAKDSLEKRGGLDPAAYANAGARRQRLLWASTGTKDPEASVTSDARLRR
jgi:glucose-6-phosphate 1-dehydrogenase